MVDVAFVLWPSSSSFCDPSCAGSTSSALHLSVWAFSLAYDSWHLSPLRHRAFQIAGGKCSQLLRGLLIGLCAFLLGIVLVLGDPTCFGLCGPNDVEVLVFGNCTVLLHRTRLLLLSFPRAARGYLLSPLSFARLHTLFVWSLVPFPQSFSSLHLLCVDGTLLFWSLCACSLVPQPCMHHSRSEALFPRASGRRLHVVHLDRVPWPCSAVEDTWLYGPISSRLFRVMTSCDSCSRRCTC